MAGTSTAVTEKKSDRYNEVVTPTSKNRKVISEDGKNKALESESAWASLYQDASFLIQNKLFEGVDRFCFASTCREWQSIAKEYSKAMQHLCEEGNVIPFLLSHNGNKGLIGHSVSEEKRYNKIEWPAVKYGKWCCGSSHGWLAIADLVGQCFRITLVHPFKKSIAPIYLPLLDFMSKASESALEYFKSNYMRCLKKVILSTDPSLNPENYFVIAIYGMESRLAIIKGGQEHSKKWVYVDKRQTNLSDAIIYKNQVYVVGDQGKIVSFNVNSCRLASSHGDHLWHVRECKSYSRVTNEHTKWFQVYKVVFNHDGGSILEQVEVKSIGDEALFLGNGHSVSVLACKFLGCKRNSIYYTAMDYWRYCGEDEGKPFHIFSLGDQTVKLKQLGNTKKVARGVWVQPMFN